MDSRMRAIVRKIEASKVLPEDVASAMRGQMARMKFRTRSGLDVEGRPFLAKKDGSPSYLNRTGTLLGSLQATAEEGPFGSIAGKVRATGRAVAYAGAVNSKRRFLGASESDRQRVVESLRASLKASRDDA